MTRMHLDLAKWATARPTERGDVVQGRALGYEWTVRADWEESVGALVNDVLLDGRWWAASDVLAEHLIEAIQNAITAKRRMRQ